MMRPTVRRTIWKMKEKGTAPAQEKSTTCVSKGSWLLKNVTAVMLQMSTSNEPRINTKYCFQHGIFWSLPAIFASLFGFWRFFLGWAGGLGGAASACGAEVVSGAATGGADSGSKFPDGSSSTVSAPSGGDGGGDPTAQSCNALQNLCPLTWGRSGCFLGTCTCARSHGVCGADWTCGGEGGGEDGGLSTATALRPALSMTRSAAAECCKRGTLVYFSLSSTFLSTSARLSISSLIAVCICSTLSLEVSIGQSMKASESWCIVC
mmetsp:Transcript_47927/g.107998  ORF Transcript_47927/g.107998 Transcript_47927/m.107998 type:complete len:264 (+) Transcript_47927:886-1677(+)